MTITLSPIATFTAATGAPRVAAIEYPLGQNFGYPGDVAGQTAVLRATLKAVAEIKRPGEIYHLPFEWQEPPHKIKTPSHPPPPIAQAIIRRPWLYKRLIDGNIPE